LLRRNVLSSLYATHIALHPELKLESPTTAIGVWRMQDIVHYTEKEPGGFYPDIKGGEASLQRGQRPQ
jgi:hypothetical protein